MTKWVVLKFGGTSVSGRAEWETIASVIRARLAEGLQPLVVCSAVSGISNLLEEVIVTALDDRHGEHLDTLEARHQKLAIDLGIEVPANVQSLFGDLRRLAAGIALLGEVSPRTHARIMSAGELMSTRMGHAFLRTLDLDVAWCDARDLLTSNTPEDMSERRSFLSATCSDEPSQALSESLAARAKVILTQGFIARNADGDTVLLGRGGSDTSAATMAARVMASRCEIWTDVPGMFTANPRLIPGARLLKQLQFDEAQEIASTGAKVLHPRCIPPVRRHQIPLWICCTREPELEGTRIADGNTEGGPQVKAISSKSGLTLISMDTVGMWQRVGFLADIFGCFRKHGLSIDLVSTSEANVTVSLDPLANALSNDTVDALVHDLRDMCRVRVIRACAAVSLVGRQIRATLHRLGPALSLFEEQQIHLVSQAASDLNLTFVVDDEQADRLVRELHGMLFQDHSHDSLFGPTWQSLFNQPSPTGSANVSALSTPWWIARRDALLTLGAEAAPCYVYDAPTLRKTASQLQALNTDRCFYAMKANSHPEILKAFFDIGLGFECVSPGELEHIFTLFPSISPDRLLFTPNFAPREEYAQAFERGVHVTLDNLHPLQAWPEVFHGQRVLIRLDPGEGRGHHQYVKTAGARSKFGVSVDQLDTLEALVKNARVNVVGLHAHTGSGVRTPDNWRETAIFLATVAERFPSVKTLNLGGGFGVPERPGDDALDLDAVNASLQAFRAVQPDFEIWIEPGRYLVATAGVLLGRVTQLKNKGSLTYVGLNVGMNSLIRPALYGAYHDIVNLTRLNEPHALIANIVGPICESGDTLGYDRPLPNTQEGDVLLISTAGAYGRVMGSSYNLRSPAQEIVLTSA